MNSVLVLALRLWPHRFLSWVNSVCVIMAVGTWSGCRRNQSEETFMIFLNVCNQDSTAT